MNLIHIKAEDYGLEEKKALEISDMFKPMLEKMVELEKDFNEVMKLGISPTTCDKARELRLAYVKVRRGTVKIHHKLKESSLQWGRFVDSWKKAQLMASEGNEDALKEIEDHYINIEKERIANLDEERADELKQYEIAVIPENLGAMPDEVWNNYLTGTKANYETKIEAERKAEEEREEQKRLDNLEKGRFRQAIKYKLFWAENDYSFRTMSELDFEELMPELKKRKSDYEAEQERIKLENERLQKQVEAEQKAREEAERKVQARIEAEQKVELERITKEKEKMQMQDKDKMVEMKKELLAVTIKYEFKSTKYRKLHQKLNDAINERN